MRDASDNQAQTNNHHDAPQSSQSETGTGQGSTTNSANSTDSISDKVAEAALEQLKAMLSMPEHSQGLFNTVTEAATEAATQAATQAATEAASRAATNHAMEESTKALKTLVESAQFKDSIATAVATDPTVKNAANESAKRAAAEAASSNLWKNISSEDFLRALAEMIASRESFGQSVTETANKVVQELVSSGGLVKMLSTKEIAEKVIQSQAFETLRMELEHTASNAASSNTSDSDLLQSLLKKTNEISTLKVSFEKLKSSIADLEKRLVEADVNEEKEKQALLQELERLTAEIESNTQKTDQIDSIEAKVDELKIDSKFCLL